MSTVLQPAADNLDTTLKLQMRPSNRVAAALGALFASGLEVIWVALLTNFQFGHLDGGARFGLSVVLALIVANGYFVVHLARLTFSRGPAIRITNEALTITDPQLLRKPLIIPRGDLRAVSVVTAESPSWWDASGFEVTRMSRGIEWTARDDETLDAIDAQTRFVLPLVSTDAYVTPNALVLLDKPLNLDKARRRGWLHLELRRFRFVPAPPRRAFLLAVENVDGARRAFEKWGVVRKLGVQDADVIEPTKTELRRYRRQMLAASGLGLYGILVIGRALLHLLHPFLK